MLARLMRPMMVTPLTLISLVRARKLAISAALGGQIDDHRPWLHALHHLCGDQHGRLLARHHRGGDDHIAFGDHAAEQFPLAGIESFVLRGRITASVLRVFGLDGQFDEAAAEALHLFFDGGPHVIGGNHRAEALGRGDGLQPRDAAADDQHARGGNRARGGGHHGIKLGKHVGGDDHGFIAANGGHGGERVHGLRARGARHQLDGERARARGSDFLQRFPSSPAAAGSRSEAGCGAAAGCRLCRCGRSSRSREPG